MILSEKQREFSLHVGMLIIWAYQQGYEITLGHVWRSPDEQKRLYDNKLSNTLKSKHLDRLAVDINLWKDGQITYAKEDYKPLADYWESLHDNNRAGYYFKSINDPYHFERS